MNDATVADPTMVHTLDLHHQGVPELIAAHLIELEAGRCALVDPGPGRTLTRLRSELHTLGYEPRDIAAIFVTHVHLDHAGGAAELAIESGAPLYAHPRAAPHLLDPTRLWESARRIYGSQMDPLWGAMVPLPPGQLRVLQNGDRVDLAGTHLWAIEARGHANHQHAYLSIDGALFPGDAAAIRLPGQATPMPATAPPEIDLVAWAQTLATFAALPIGALYLPHFGPVHDVAAHLTRLRGALLQWSEVIAEGLAAGDDHPLLAARLEGFLRAELRREGVAADAADRAILAAGPMMCAIGLRRALSQNTPGGNP
jgi:glyoxylase-like metal-dependent hydrolase (beta-lactamase superfamily II)